MKTVLGTFSAWSERVRVVRPSPGYKGPASFSAIHSSCIGGSGYSYRVAGKARLAHQRYFADHRPYKTYLGHDVRCDIVTISEQVHTAEQEVAKETGAYFLGRRNGMRVTNIQEGGEGQ